MERNALPEPEFETNDTYNAPRDAVEKKLASIWFEVLGIGAKSTQRALGIDDNFFHLGGIR